jgi:hypothetical protein
MNRRYVQGLTTVEFAIVGLLALVALIAVLEVGRALFVFNALDESTRRGARMAVVCAPGDPAIVQTALFATGGGASPLVNGLSADHIAVEYLTTTGSVIADPAANYGAIRYVRVRIDDYEHQLLIPLFMTRFTTPEFPTTLPRESLGVSREGTYSC